MHRAERLSRGAWAIVGLLWVVATLNYLDRQLVVTMPGPIKGDLQIGDERFGLLSSVFLWIYGVCSPVAGYIADRVGKRPVIIASLLIWSAATLVTGIVTSFEGMLAARAMLGVSEAFYMPAAVALIVEYHRGPTRSRATGLHLSGVYAGSVLGGLGGAFAEMFGWRTGFVAMGAIGVAYALVLMIFFPRTSDKAAPAEIVSAEISTSAPLLSGAFKSLLTTRGFLFLLAMNLLNGAAYWPVRNWLPEFFRSELGVSQAWAGVYGPMAFNGAAFGGMLIASNISDWWSRWNERARALVPAIGFMIAAPCLFAVGAVEYIPVILACVLVAGMSQGFLDANLMPAACTVTDFRHRATAYGLLNFVGTTAGGAMTYVGGMLKEQQVPFATTFQAASLLIFVAGLCLFAVRPARCDATEFHASGSRQSPRLRTS
ncbi:major facilitator superfamily protein [Hyphomicrobium denitrificans 1NES1]|uniref:Major facilitator superfamily protein n=1 Tax=Hyphomicrobium denitrificans 1NES1 TaxID=670307 RepID=N0BEC2_9HYPH|nr:MFS transporter [Hyphomicrobium denitrificans]AGK58460.1 major facilitator superfamily protein [Hyphomicrobium denitrificans 1NES1]